MRLLCEKLGESLIKKFAEIRRIYPWPEMEYSGLPLLNEDLIGHVSHEDDTPREYVLQSDGKSLALYPKVVYRMGEDTSKKGSLFLVVFSKKPLTGCRPWLCPYVHYAVEEVVMGSGICFRPLLPQWHLNGSFAFGHVEP